MEGTELYERTFLAQDFGCVCGGCGISANGKNRCLLREFGICERRAICCQNELGSEGARMSQRLMCRFDAAAAEKCINNRELVRLILRI